VSSLVGMESRIRRLMKKEKLFFSSSRQPKGSCKNQTQGRKIATAWMNSASLFMLPNKLKGKYLVGIYPITFRESAEAPQGAPAAIHPAAGENNGWPVLLPREPLVQNRPRPL
jgi:hypothetical protein